MGESEALVKDIFEYRIGFVEADTMAVAVGLTEVTSTAREKQILKLFSCKVMRLASRAARFGIDQLAHLWLFGRPPNCTSSPRYDLNRKRPVTGLAGIHAQVLNGFPPACRPISVHVLAR